MADLTAIVGGRLESHADEALVRQRNVDRPHEADRHRSRAEWACMERSILRWERGDLDRRDAPGIQQTVAGQRWRAQIFSSSSSSRRSSRGTRCLGGLLEFGKEGYVFSREGSGSASRSSRRPCIGSDSVGPGRSCDRRRTDREALNPAGQAAFGGTRATASARFKPARSSLEPAPHLEITATARVKGTSTTLDAALGDDVDGRPPRVSEPTERKWHSARRRIPRRERRGPAHLRSLPARP